jgi:DNA-binding transcriptional regulator PaaX
MKQSTKVLLSWLYTPDERAPRVLLQSEFEWLLPEMTSAGRRSFLHYLNAQRLIHREPSELGWRYAITQFGSKALKAEFPALSEEWQTWQGEWSGLVFKHSPPSDPQFRYLRTVLIEAGAQALARGVFIFPGQFPSRVLELCESLYIDSIVIFAFSQWLFGDERSTITELFNLQDLISLYSGISKESSNLLSVFNSEKGSKDQSKRRFKDLFYRFLTVLEQTPGLFHHYYPHSPSPPGLLKQLQTIVSIE